MLRFNAGEYEYPKSNKEEYESALEAAIKAKRHWISSELEDNVNKYLDNLGSDRFYCDYEECILPYWSIYDQKPKRLWFDYYGGRGNVSDPRFIPDDFYYFELLPYLNNLQFGEALADKCIFARMLPDIKQPVTVCSRISGEFYDTDGRLIDKTKAARICIEDGETLFFKESLYTSKAQGVRAITPQGRTLKDYLRFFDEMGANFIVQEKVHQHEELSHLCNSGVCTIRIDSLFLNSKVTIISEVIRIPGEGRKYCIIGSPASRIQDGGQLDTTVE
ncbi:hypothetical protein [Butyrivibrio sp. AE3004]|uniref:hypothetical protein n=1 Tax=Butyrivibrio sp. AE3004 TaxID=1506994 RepID=UPI0004948713|nr:hypothetical protein [Butyrivibrio sp. AE3004]